MKRSSPYYTHVRINLNDNDNNAMYQDSETLTIHDYEYYHDCC